MNDKSPKVAALAERHDKASTAATNKKTRSLNKGKNPIFQEIARFRAIIIDSKLKPYDITMSQCWVLVHLLQEEGPKQLELAERLHIATVTTSKLIDQLELRGYAERRPDPQDRRSNRVYATPGGRKLIKVITQTVQEVDQISNEGITDEELTVTLKVLNRMRSNLKQALPRKSQ